MKNNKAITLIALVITIVVLIILATVVINLSLGDNGIFNRARTAKQQYQNAEGQEKTDIAKVTNEIDGMTDGIIMGGRGPITRTILYDTVTTSTTSTPVTLNDDIKNYDYLIINIAWRYDLRNTTNEGAQNRQYYLDTSLIDLKDNSDIAYDYLFTYGFSSATDYAGLCFMKQNKLKISITGVQSGASVAVTKIIGIKF